jgi:hypothetical protein
VALYAGVKGRGEGRPLVTPRVVLAAAVLLGALLAAPVAADETIRCGRRKATLVGTPGADEIRGTADADVIHTLAGDDRVWGLGDNDRVCGGRGDDRVYGGTQNDKVYGLDGSDRVHGGRGDDFVDIADMVGGNDVATGGPGDDHCALDAFGAVDEIGQDCEAASSGISFPPPPSKE